ncbi:MAG: hypothetical protein ACJAYU_005316 [Bradymonadia bacterium]|jgi:hypothetical protein
MTVRTLAALTLLAFVVACGSDDEPAATDAGTDEEASDALDPGLNDDARRVDVSVPEPSTPRAFRMGIAVPTDGLGEEFGQLSWQYAAAHGDAIAIRLDGGLPWAEILEEDAALPAEYEAFLADLADRVGGTQKDLLLIVDPFDANRTGFAPDALGREPVTAGLTFEDRGLRAGYEAFCEDLALRFQPKYFVPFPDINVYGANRGDEFDALREHYEELRQTVKFASGQTLVFPTWDFVQLSQAIRSGNQLELGWIGELDEAGDFFAVDFRPALEGEAAADLSAAPFTDLDRRELSSVTTRKLLIIDAGYPAAGVVQNGEVFASSENSQFNYLAFLLGLGDSLDLELIVWSAAVDPDRWLLDPCAGEECDLDRLEERYGELRRHGLLDSDGSQRAATPLWEQFAERSWVP